MDSIPVAQASAPTWISTSTSPLLLHQSVNSNSTLDEDRSSTQELAHTQSSCSSILLLQYHTIPYHIALHILVPFTLHYPSYLLFFKDQLVSIRQCRRLRPPLIGARLLLSTSFFIHCPTSFHTRQKSSLAPTPQIHLILFEHSSNSNHGIKQQ